MILSGKGRELKIESIAKNLTVSIEASYERKELGGQSSSTAFADGGSKPKKVSCGMVIPFTSKDGLTKLFEMAEAVDEKGNPLVYTVSDNKCAAARIRQVIFAGSISVKQSDSLLADDVSFSLQEFQSVAEKREDRKLEKAEKAEAADDGTEKVASTDPSKINDAIEKAKAS